MSVGTAWTDHSLAYDDADPIVPVTLPRPILPLPTALPQQLMGAAALTCIAFSCAWALCVNLGGGSADNNGAMRSDRLAVAADRGDRLEAEDLTLPPSGNTISAFDDRFSAAFPPGVFLGNTTFAAAEPAPSEPQGRRVADLTPPPAHLSLAPHLHRHDRPAPLPPEPEQQTETVASAPPQQPTLLERLFGMHTPSSVIFTKLYGPPPSKVTLAFAEDGATGDSANVTTGLFDRETAVYDISTHTVYLPNGKTLEAHSGYGDRLDDPDSAHVRDRGVTPPDIYDLQPRGRLFHGVQALRLVPEDQTKVFGRAGLLAHTYMLGPTGQSNGCVSFKDYDEFLQAYEAHEITRLAVVSHID